MDGAVMTDRRWNMSLFSQAPGVGAVQEFTVLADAVSAKYTRPVNVVVSTKSGTDQFHGTAYETIRNSSIGVARRRQDNFTKAPHLVRNEFGFNAGGPLVIPKVYNGRKRVFWFFNYEALRQAGRSTINYNLPTVAMRNGDFSGLRDSQNRLQVLYDPLSTGPAPNYQRTPFIGNVIPVDRESPTAKFLYSITPLPNNALIRCSTSTGMANRPNSTATRPWSAASIRASRIAIWCTHVSAWSRIPNSTIPAFPA